MYTEGKRISMGEIRTSEPLLKLSGIASPYSNSNLASLQNSLLMAFQLSTRKKRSLLFLNVLDNEDQEKSMKYRSGEFSY